MSNIIENVNPKKNPVTSIGAILFLLVSVAMSVVKYLVPAFVVLKQDIPYPGYYILIGVGVAILLAFLDDKYFARLFGRFDKVMAKRTETEDKVVEEIKIEKKPE
jgi:hypothetical protein